jgi:hypothetical protein
MAGILQRKESDSFGNLFGNVAQSCHREEQIVLSAMIISYLSVH